MLETNDNERTTFDRMSQDREFYQFPFTSADFQQIREMIHRAAGISLSPSKQDLVYSRLARRLKIRCVDSFAGYIRLLQSGDLQEMEAFINALTTNMTSFFREAHHFPILSRHLGAIREKRPISIWTCASSSGEEPYSIAMTAVQALGSFAAPVRILATDIDTNVLEKAKRGIYPMDQLQKLTKEQLKQFFFRGEGQNQGFAKVRPELRNMITFRPFNLLDDEWPMTEQYDAIFCRNVMIYFDKDTQHQILNKMAPKMKPHGLFFAGHSESFHHAANLFKVCEKTVYSLK